MPSSTHLDLRGDDVRGLAQLRSRHTHLQSLCVHSCQWHTPPLVDLSPLRVLSRLETCELVGLVWVTDFSALAALHRLRTFVIEQCPHFVDAGVLHHSRKTLHTVSVKRCGATGTHSLVNRLFHQLRGQWKKNTAHTPPPATKPFDVTSFPVCPYVQKFECAPVPNSVNHLQWLQRAFAPQTLRTLILHAKGLTDWTALHAFAPTLTSLDIQNVRKIHVEALRNATALRTLTLWGAQQQQAHSTLPSVNLTPLVRCTKLTTLTCNRVLLPRTVPPLPPALATLVVRWSCTQDWINRLHASAPQLTTLDLSGDVYNRGETNVSDLRPLLRCASLTSIDVRNNNGMTPARIQQFIAHPKAVERAFVLGTTDDRKRLAHTFHVDAWHVTDSVVSAYARNRHLRTLALHGAFVFTHFPALVFAGAALQTVEIGGTNVRDLTPLVRLPCLAQLGCCDSAGNAAPILDVAPLVDCRALRTLNIRRCNHLTELYVLCNIPTLTALDVRGCDSAPVAEIERVASCIRKVQHDLSKRRKARVFRTLDNGGHAFEVRIQPDQHVTVWRASHQKQQPVFDQRVAQVFIGHSPLNRMTAYSGGYGAKRDGNAVLLRIARTSLRYLFVGDIVFTFVAKHPITRFVSPVGNSSVPYPYAVDEPRNEYYLFGSNVICCNLSPTTTDPAYDNNQYLQRHSKHTRCTTIADKHHLSSLVIGDQLRERGVGCAGLSETDASAFYETRIKQTRKNRKRHGMPATYVDVIATYTDRRSRARRRTRNSNTTQWYRLPHTIVSDIFPMDTTSTCTYEWHYVFNVAYQCLLIRQHAAHNVKDVRLFTSIHEARAYANGVNAIVHTSSSASSSAVPVQDTPPAPAYFLHVLLHPIKLRPHPDRKGHQFIYERRSTAPHRTRILTRKTYLAMRQKAPAKCETARTPFHNMHVLAERRI